MGEYIKLFSEHTDYTTYRNGNMVLPNVSYCSDTPNEVHYNPFTGAWLEVTYTISDISSATTLWYDNSGSDEDYISGMEIDGVGLENIVDTYQFSATGQHVVKYRLANPTTLDFCGLSGNSEVVALTIPDTVVYITASFASTSLTSVTIPDSVEAIHHYAFTNMPYLSSIVFGSSVSLLESEVVSSSVSLTMTFKNPVPVSIGVDSFFVDYDNLTNIYVPEEAVDTYKAASGWSAYASIISAIPSNP